MSSTGKPILKTHSDQLKLLPNDVSKPYFNQLYSGSPVSPLQPEPTSSTTSSSSSGSVPGRVIKRVHFRSDSKTSVNTSPSCPLSGSSGSKPGHTRPVSSKSSVTSPVVHVIPSGNIKPSGKILKTVATSSQRTKPDVLSFGTSSYGHGSIVRGCSNVKGEIETSVSVGLSSSTQLDAEELRRLGREQYKMGNYLEALSYYNGAVDIEPDNPGYRCYRVAALMCLYRLNEAVEECYEVIKLDSGYMRAHRRLGSLLIR